MSLPLLVIIVAVGIAAVVVSVHLTGGSARARLDGPDAARRRFAEDFPELGVRHVLLTAVGDSAFLDLADGRIGMVLAIGGKFLTRILTEADLAGAPRADGRLLRLGLRDYTSKGGSFEFAGADEAAAAERLFTRRRTVDRWEATR